MTLATLPLVMHAMDTRAIYAGKKYLLLSMAGAAMVFVSIISLHEYGTTLDFTWGGVIPQVCPMWNGVICTAHLFWPSSGFGGKGSSGPFHSWLPAASVAPTPVSALLHAVAVVKGGRVCADAGGVLVLRGRIPYRDKGAGSGSVRLLHYHPLWLPSGPFAPSI